MGSEAAKKAWETRRKQKLLKGFKDRFKLKRKLKKPTGYGAVVVVNGQKMSTPSKIASKAFVQPKAKKKPTAKGTAAAKKAWETRRANAEDPVQAEKERQEALRVLDELAKNRPPVTEE